MAPDTTANALFDFSDDPFASDDDQQNDADQASSSNKRKDADALGLNETVTIAKKQRVPTVKLDEARLLSDKGISRLRKRANQLQFKGKGHEFSDAARLLSFYQLWLDDLFPKAKFLDALAMVEKLGHKKAIHVARMKWIDEGKPKPAREEEEQEEEDDNGDKQKGRGAARFPARVAPIFENGRNRPNTPDRIPPDDEDLYGATPAWVRDARAEARVQPNGQERRMDDDDDDDDDDDVDDEEDLDALMAESEAARNIPAAVSTSTTTVAPSLFGTGSGAAPPADDPDDLDALMAEVEAKDSRPKAKATSTIHEEKEEPSVDADEEEAMAELDGLW